VNILAERALNSVEQGLLNAPPATLGFKPPKTGSKDDGATSLDPSEQAKNEIEAGTHQLETLLCASVDRDFDKFEIYVLRNIFCLKPADIGNYIRLGHYDGLDFSGDEGTKTSLEAVNALRRRLRESMRLNALLHTEHERNARMLADLHAIVGGGPSEIKVEDSVNGKASAFGFLREHVTQLKDSGAETPLSTTTAFTLSQLQALRALSKSLRTVAPDLAPPPTEDEDGEGAFKNEDGGEVDDGDDKGKKSWRRERLAYVEGATRRHLENVQGLELGKDGEVRDGEWQGEGRRFGMGEVEGLERIVTMLGGKNGTPSARPQKEGSEDNEGEDDDEEEAMDES
jgi:kinetochore protein Mis12/MTW1